MIKSESIAHLLSREETDNYDTLVRINEYVQTFTINFERISAQLDQFITKEQVKTLNVQLLPAITVFNANVIL